MVTQRAKCCTHYPNLCGSPWPKLAYKANSAENFAQSFQCWLGSEKSQGLHMKGGWVKNAVMEMKKGEQNIHRKTRWNKWFENLWVWPLLLQNCCTTDCTYYNVWIMNQDWWHMHLSATKLLILQFSYYKKYRISEHFKQKYAIVTNIPLINIIKKEQCSLKL